MKYNKGLDALRGFAVLLVIYQHWGPLGFRIPWLKYIFTHLIPSGTFGVDIFFVLSGFLITRILLDARIDRPDNRIDSLKTFYLRRVLRIFPIYFLFIFLIAYILQDNYVKNHLSYFVTYTSNLLYINGGVSWQTLPHTWSLAVEEQYYIIWPWVIIFTSQQNLQKVILFFITLGIISSLVLYSFYGYYFTFLLPACFVAFGLGAWYAHLTVYQLPIKWLPVALKIAVPLCIILLFVNQLFYQVVLIRLSNSIIGVGLIYFIEKQQFTNGLQHLFENRLLVRLGKISYGVYLYHFVLPFYYSISLNYLLGKQLLSTNLYRALSYIPLKYTINFVLVIVISAISFRFIETPFLNLKRYFSYRGHTESLPG